jgi:hypothetical protein
MALYIVVTDHSVFAYGAEVILLNEISLWTAGYVESIGCWRDRHSPRTQPNMNAMGDATQLKLYTGACSDLSNRPSPSCDHEETHSLSHYASPTTSEDPQLQASMSYGPTDKLACQSTLQGRHDILLCSSSLVQRTCN